MCKIPTKVMSRQSQAAVPADTRQLAEEMLREAAFVLQMTRRVKQAILKDARCLATERSNVVTPQVVNCAV
jgi:hypothetical protein